MSNKDLINKLKALSDGSTGCQVRSIVPRNKRSVSFYLQAGTKVGERLHVVNFTVEASTEDGDPRLVIRLPDYEPPNAEVFAASAVLAIIKHLAAGDPKDETRLRAFLANLAHCERTRYVVQLHDEWSQAESELN